MYFCLRCTVFHNEDESAENICKTGYVLREEIKIPLGVCKEEASE